MSLFPQLRQACHRGRQATATATPGGALAGARAERDAEAALSGHSPPLGGAASAPEGHPYDAEVNHVVLSGVLVEEPQERCSAEGQPFTALFVGFRAPDAKPGEGWPSACCEVEVPEGTPQRQVGELRPGASILVTGRLGGGAGGVVATFLHASAPDEGAVS
jgi:hypothetical protein